MPKLTPTKIYLTPLSYALIQVICSVGYQDLEELEFGNS